MKPTNHQDKTAAFFNALAHRRRQMLCDLLLPYGAKGISFGRLMAHSGLTSATLAHHLKVMNHGGILRRQPKGRETWVSIDRAALRLGAFDYGSKINAA